MHIVLYRRKSGFGYIANLDPDLRVASRVFCCHLPSSLSMNTMATNTVMQSTIQDLIQIKPQDFGKPSAEAIKDAINDKYSNKIVPGVGLCIALWDLLTATEGLIGHGTGLVNVNGTHSHMRILFRVAKFEQSSFA